jgi:cellulose biosynthesis protein BcsQ
MKVISIYSRKGGCGKTTISFHLCKNLDKSFFITNDDDGGEIVIEKLGSDKASLVKNKIPKTMDYLIYDGGGFVDDLSLKFLLNSNSIIIPSNLENRSLRSARKVINELIQNHRVKSNKIINKMFIVFCCFLQINDNRLCFSGIFSEVPVLDCNVKSFTFA